MMIRRLFFIFSLLVAAATPVQANLMDAWHEVQANLASGNAAGAERAAQVLEERAGELDVRRMTAFATALVRWAEGRPGTAGETAVRIAQRLDPDYPTSYFLEARWAWQRGTPVAAIRGYASGWVSLIRFEPTRRIVGAWLAYWSIFSLALAFLAMIVVVTFRYLRSSLHDARELGGKMFRSANAWVFGVVILLLPIFAGLGPIWLLVYLFSLSWIYLGQRLRIWAFVACLSLSLFVPTLEWIQENKLQARTLSDRVAVMLDERQLDFSSLRETDQLATELDEIALYHLIYGELLRMHGEPARAKVQFQKAALLDEGQARPLIFVGNLELEEGNTKRAIQLFNQALEINERNSFAYHNLSLAFDLTRRFQEGDEARARAREIAGRDSAENGLRGLDPRIRYPWLTSRDVDHLIDELDPDQRLSMGHSSFSLDPFKKIGTELSAVFIVGAILGLIVLLVRLRTYPPARECTKCGKLYRMAQGFGESSVYCSQCVSVFQKRDVVSIEQQTAKLRQIRHWETVTSLVRRVGAFVIPGSPSLLDGEVVRGLITGFFAWFFLTGALIWIPLYLEQIEPLALISYFRPACFVLFGLIVLKSGVAGWNRR